MLSRHSLCLTGLLLTATPALCAEEKSTVRLDTSLEEPYQVAVDGELAGQSVTVLECIFEHLQQPYRIQLTSVSRARQSVSRHIADGFFSSAPDSQVDGYAQLSAPLLMEKWYWYAYDPLILTKPIWDQELRIGRVLGSNSMTWLDSHARCFAFLGGVPEIVVPDNLRSAVSKSHRYEPDINPSYRDLAEHYGVAVVPARARKPRDKAKAEVRVQVVEQVIQQAALVRTQLLAALGKLVPFVPSDFVCEPLNDGLIAVDLLAHHVDLRQ